MIYRAMVLTVVALLAGVAWVSAPAVEPLPDGGQEPLSQSGVYFCTGSGVEPITDFQALSGSAGEASISIVDSNEVLDTQMLSSDAAGSIAYNTGGRLFAGGAVVEVESSAAGAAWVSQGPTRITATSCHDRHRATWLLTGGRIGAEDRLVLRLFNPALSSAKADVLISTEFGPEPITELEAVGVSPRDVIEIPLHEILGQRSFVNVQVLVTEGNLFPAIVSTTPNGIATWSDATPSSDWYVPTVRVGGVVGDLLIHNPRNDLVEVEVFGIDSSGLATDDFEPVTLDARGFIVIPADTLGPVVLGARVFASSPVVVSLVGDAEAGRFGEVGLAAIGTSWMVPGAGSEGAVDVWIFNPSPTAAQVTVGLGPASRSIRVSAGTSSHLTIDAGDGALVSSDADVAVSWSTQGKLSLSNGWLLR
jgi:hypothetical protein